MAPDSTTPTFAALKLLVNNWRWAGVSSSRHRQTCGVEGGGFGCQRHEREECHKNSFVLIDIQPYVPSLRSHTQAKRVINRQVGSASYMPYMLAHFFINKDTICTYSSKL